MALQAASNQIITPKGERSVLTEDEKWHFDIQGYVILPQAISSGDVKRMLELTLKKSLTNHWEPLPNSLKEKLKVLNKAQEKVIKIKKPFAFFNIFKVQYAGIAAALALFFYGGFYTQGVMMAKKSGSGTEMQAAGKKIDKKMKITSDDLSARIANVYKFFDEEKFTDEVNNVIADLKEGDEFELSLKDGNGNIIKFVLVKNFESEDGFQCKDIAFKQKTLLSRTDLGTDLKLSMCKKDDRYKLVSINLSK